MRWNDKSEWIFSDEMTHEPLISEELFEAAERQRLLGQQRRVKMRASAKRCYPLASLIHCGALHEDGTVCGRRMTGSWNNGQRHYRCVYPSEYAGTTGKHPQAIYLKEADLTPALDEWLLRHFDPKHLDATVAAMAAAQAPDEAGAARAEAARKRLADCDARLRKYRAALEEGNPPGIVFEWMREVETERLAAQRELDSQAESAPLSEGEIRALVRAVRKGLVDLAKATPERKQAIYAELGLRLTYHPDEDSVTIEATPDACTGLRVGGGTLTLSTPAWETSWVA